MKPRRVRGLDPEAPLRPNAGLSVETRLAELLLLAGPALEPEGEDAQHDLRIAAKRLRYLLELTAPCFGPEAHAAAAVAKELQRVLGEIHDCDVMLAGSDCPDSLRAHLRSRRQLRFRHFRELWWRESAAGTWLALQRSL